MWPSGVRSTALVLSFAKATCSGWVISTVRPGRWIVKRRKGFAFSASLNAIVVMRAVWQQPTRESRRSHSVRLREHDLRKRRNSPSSPPVSTQIALNQTMSIVVLDGHTLNPGDLNWEALKALGPCAIYERSTPAEVLKRAADAEILITNKVPLGPEQIRALPRLRYIGVTATGYNIIDVAAARERGITVTNVPAY